jgi:hypothetical protein
VRALAAALLFVVLAGCAGPSARVVPHGYARITLACSDLEADVSIDGAPAGKAKDYAGRAAWFLVRPGRHRIEFVGASGAREVREAVLAAGDDVWLAVLFSGGN